MINSKVTDGELEWLRKPDVKEMRSADTVTFLVKAREELAKQVNLQIYFHYPKF